MRETLYDYGLVAWAWRFLIAFLVLLAAGFLAVGISTLDPLAIVGAVALLAPVAFFGTVVVIRASRLEDGGLQIETLLFIRRRIAADRLGVPRVRSRYRAIHGDLVSPRVWVPVRGGWPIYFDLFGRIPDRQAFLKAIRLRATELNVHD